MQKSNITNVIANRKAADQTEVLKPLISIVIAVYNRENTLEQCLQSVINQDFQDFELVVIDGGSSDNTLQVLSDYSEQLDYCISEPDSGIYDAWNKGLAQISGEWVCFVGSDDYFRDETVLGKIAQRLISLPKSIKFAYSQVMLVNQDGTDLFLTGTGWDKAQKQINRGMSVPHPAMMHRASMFTEGRYFDKEFSIAGDYELFLRESTSDNVVFLDGLTSISMRQGGISSQYSNYRKSLLECRKAQKRYGQRIPSLLWMVDLVLADFRIALFRVIGDKQAKKFIDAIRRLFGLPAYWSQL